MAGPIVVMKRYEMKYILDAAQTAFLRERLKGHMEVDHFLTISVMALRNWFTSVKRRYTEAKRM